MQIKTTNNVNFNAKFYSYPKTTTNKEIYKLFEEKTSKYPQLILKQDDISYFGNDYFVILNKNKPNSIESHGYFNFTHNPPQNIEDFVNRLKEIFDILNKKKLPEMHKDKIIY